MDRVEQGWIGIDAGKGHHHAVLIDRDGQRLLSRRVINDQPDLVALIDTVEDRVIDPVWAIDLAAGSASLVITLLLERGQRVVYLPGIAVNRATAAYRGEGKTDAKDAAIIADQARMRRDPRAARPGRRHRPASAAQFLSCRSGRRPHPQHQPAPRSACRRLSCPGTSAGLH
jgi:Transposase